MSAFWLNGRLVDEREATVSVTDRGFALGDGLFETMRAYGDHVFRWREHLERLRAGAERIGIAMPGGLDEALRETLAASGLRSASLRLTLSRGPGGQGLLPPEEARPTCAVVARPYTPAQEEQTLGASAIVSRARIDEQSITAGLKRIGYLDAVLAQREARAAGARDALLLDTAGHLAEAASANLFVVRGGVLLTPPLSCGILPGITRAAVLQIASGLGVSVEEAPFAEDALRGADEAFLTSSLREIVPLVRVDGRPVGAGRPGALTLRLLDAYRGLVRAEADQDAR